MRNIRDLLEYGDVSDASFHAPEGNDSFLVLYPGGDRLPGVGSYASSVTAYRLVRKEKKVKRGKGKDAKEESEHDEGKGDGDKPTLGAMVKA